MKSCQLWRLVEPEERKQIMVNQDIGFNLMELARRIAEIENVIGKLKKEPINSEKDWDNATLMQEWGISKRTAANYRQKGLAFYKRGGLVFYKPESREKFIKNKNDLNDGNSSR